MLSPIKLTRLLSMCDWWLLQPTERAEMVDAAPVETLNRGQQRSDSSTALVPAAGAGDLAGPFGPAGIKGGR